MKTAIKNFISDAVPEIVMILLNLVLLKLFYNNLGTDIYALYQIFSQFFAYLLLAEAGFSSAALVSLYKPIANNNTEEINKKLSGIKYVFNRIGMIMIGVGTIVAFIIPYMIKDNTFENGYIFITFILYLLSNSLNYFFYTYRIFYDAKKQKYVSNFVYQTGAIFKYIVEIILLLLKCKFEYVLIACTICNLLTDIFMKYYTLHNNKFLKLDKNNKDTTMLKDTKDIMVHKISGVIANNIDIVLISSNLGLSYVAIYGAYNYIVNEITKFTSKIGTSLYSIIGIDYFKNESFKINKNKFIEYNAFIIFLATIICSSLVFAYNSFIELFYGKEMLAPKLVGYIFIILIFLKIIRTTLNTYTNACGLFKETKVCTITEAIINLVLSLISIKYFKMAGILGSTIIAYIVTDFIIKPIVVKKKLGMFTFKEFYLEEMRNVICFVLLICLNSYLFKFNAKNYFEWFFISTGIFIMNSILSFIYFKLIKRTTWFDRIIKSIRRKNEN